MELVETRRCGLCKQHLPVSEFSPQSMRCRPCYNAYRRAGRAEGKWLYPLSKERMDEVRKSWKERNRTKRLSQKRLQEKIRHGKVIRPTHCPRCGKEGKIHAHHTDYENDIYEWLCPRCHSHEHFGISE